MGKLIDMTNRIPQPQEDAELVYRITEHRNNFSRVLDNLLINKQRDDAVNNFLAEVSDSRFNPRGVALVYSPDFRITGDIPRVQGYCEAIYWTAFKESEDNSSDYYVELTQDPDGLTRKIFMIHKSNNTGLEVIIHMKQPLIDIKLIPSVVQGLSREIVANRKSHLRLIT